MSFIYRGKYQRDLNLQIVRMNFTRLYNHFILIFLAVSGLSSLAAADNSGSSLCKSSVCQKIGEELMQSIDNTIDPCTDFYQHACGEWQKKNPVPNWDLTWNQYDVIKIRVMLNIKELLEKKEIDDSEATRKAKQYYNICVDTDAIDRTGIKPVLDILASNGKWPMIVPRSQWSLQNLTWLQIHENIVNLTATSLLFEVNMLPDLTNAKAYIVTVSIPDHLSDDAYINKYKLRSYQIMSNELGLNVSLDETKADIIDDVFFKTALQTAASVDADSDFDNEKSYRKTTIKKLQKLWDAVVKNNTQFKVDWLEIIKRKFEGTDIVIDRNEKILLQPKVYFKKLASLLLKTPMRTIVNFMQRSAIESIMEKLLHNGTREMELETFRRDGYEETQKRWFECISSHPMPDAVSLMYVNKYFTNRTRASVQELLPFFRDAANENIDNSSWMNDSEKKLAKKKVNAMKYEIGYPEWYDEDGRVDDYYKKLIFGSNYYENKIAAERFKANEILHKLREPVDQYSTGCAIEVNASYWIHLNSIFLAAALLQLPKFHYEQPAVLKFATLGTMITHEISHGFDLEGRHRDKNGNKVQWWSNSTIDRYKKKIECFIEQYDRYKMAKHSNTNEIIYVDGLKTASENIADNGGYATAFLALQRYNSFHRNQTEKISALRSFSNEKIFFYGLANSVCESAKQEYFENFAHDDEHATIKVRINAGLANMKEFSDAFQCPQGSPMNPFHKCVFWD